MKISSVANVNYDLKTNKNKLANTCAKSDVSFGSGIGNAVKSGFTKTFKFIDAKGFFVEFLIVDTISMIIPRIVVGLNRDRDKTGKINYKAGIEEAGRECLSGPSMNLIPMGIMALAGLFKPASRMNKETLTSLTGNMEKVVDTMRKIPKDKTKMTKALAGQVFEEAFADHKFKGVETKAAHKAEFVKLLVDSTDTMNNADFKNKSTLFKNYVELLNKKNKAGKTLTSQSVVLSGKNVDAAHLFEDFNRYSKDIIAKFARKDYSPYTLKAFRDVAKENLNKLLKSRVNLKVASALAAFVGVGTFLLYLPKVYQQKGLSPAQESAKLAMEAAAKGGANESK